MGDSKPASPPVVFWNNLITLLGLLLAGLGLLLLLTFWLFRALSPAHTQNEYLNIVGFMVLPGVFVTGLILCPIGILFKRWRRRRYGPGHEIPVRLAITFLLLSFFLVLPVIGVSGYKGYHYSESTEFCGSCHAVMEPQYVAHQQSSHARVTCAECHIGPGAGPLVQSKLSGVRQLFAVALETYPRPIPPAIAHLRPAIETCEQCHWPERFFGSVLKPIVRYSPDEQNTRHEFDILLKVGGRNPYLGRSEGIHMHMIDRVEYVATDEGLQEIPWVRYEREDGTVTIYRSDGKAAEDPPPPGIVRRLDCMDCHNRSGHPFHSPEDAVDIFLDNRRIDDSLPFIKREAVAALAEPWPDKQAALAGISDWIRDFYRSSYPALWNERRQDVEEAIEALHVIFEQNIFPYMRVDWRTYPDNVGHLNSAGCFRCHDGLHVNDVGEAITSDCTACHTFLTRPGEPNVIHEGEFQHSMQIHELWEDFGPHRNMRCDECHGGGGESWGATRVETACGDCHESGRWLDMLGTELFRPMIAE